MGWKYCRSLFWKTRAALKKAVKNESKKRLKFQYDPSSYALNFDDGSCDKAGQFKPAKTDQNFPYNKKSSTWVYVLFVTSY
ncbi:hypothetical protein BVC80_757g10 [Macleaya cordata]|uniref:Uncharacterized protein n=1 Tax=Macleaya cordata TaxID=56857 RepID=A0A200QRW7_MACCD|nr:hypothetical protein BVC80_757g10 [Macleaya cordata]